MISYPLCLLLEMCCW